MAYTVMTTKSPFPYILILKHVVTQVKKSEIISINTQLVYLIHVQCILTLLYIQGVNVNVSQAKRRHGQTSFISKKILISLKYRKTHLFTFSKNPWWVWLFVYVSFESKLQEDYLTQTFQFLLDHFPSSAAESRENANNLCH